MHGSTPTEVARLYAERLAARLSRHGPHKLARISLYGSRARGEAGRRSDVDLMIVVRRPEREDRRAVHDVAAELELELDYTVDLSTKIVHEDRFEKLRRSALPFWTGYSRDERVLWPATSSRSE